MRTKEFEKLYESNNSTIYKGKYEDYSQDVIIKVLNAEHPTEEQITRFYNEYDFTENLDISGVRKVLKKDGKDGKSILILEYFEGEKISKYVSKNKVTIEELLQIAINIAQAIGEIHQQNIIHKDINSNNILINEQNEINIIDFGLAGQYTLKTQNISNPKHLEGTLAYISPEQTGRMNRSVDYRADLYSLGVVLYEMFTKKLPFRETDDMELVHSHIAKMPIEPNKINDKVPKILSNIILKLLSKNAEDRYQSAFGLRFDLQLCQSFELRQSFTLGKKDFSGKLSIHEKLYGRKAETDKLYEIYEKVNRGNRELLLISGYSGVGKSALIHEVHKPLTENRAFYIEGKFDLFQKNIPYLAVTQAFTDFANIILKENDEDLKYWKDLIQKSVGNVGGVLTNLIPEFELIIGKQKELPRLEGKESQNRFNYVWTSFVKAISKENHPLIFFIDDLQWADNASVQLLKLIVNDNEIRYFFPIIAYRDNEIDANDLQEFTDLENVNISSIKLGNLKQEDVNNLLKDALSNPQNFENLAKLIYSKTHGNAFFTVQFLTNLYEEAFLNFDFTENIWNWNFEEIEKQNISNNVIELMKNKIHKLPKNTQDILKIASCIGNRFELRILSIIYKKDEKTAKNILENAILENLIYPVDKRNFKFVHDKIQQAVYSTIPENEKKLFHLQTGKLLLGFLDKKSLEKHIFDVINQINHGINLIENKTERKQFAELNLQAGLKAKFSSAYFTAYNYLKISKNLLEKNSWETDYQFTLKVYDELTEISYLIGNYEKTVFFVNKIIENGSDILDEINAYYFLINTHRAKIDFKKAIKIGLEILGKLGINLIENPTQEQIRNSFIETQINLSKIEKDIFYDLDLMIDKNMLGASKILNALGTVCYISNPALLTLIIFKSFNLSLKYGHHVGGVYLLSAYGFFLSIINKVEEAKWFGKLALRLLEKHHFNNIRSKVIHINISFIDNWKKNINETLKDLIGNYKTGLEVGDSEFAAYAVVNFFAYSFYCNSNIKDLKNKAFNYIDSIKKLNQNSSLKSFLLYYQVFENISSEKVATKFLSGKYYNEIEETKILKENKVYSVLARYYQLKLGVLYLFNKSEEFENIIQELISIKKGLQGYYYFALINFYHSLCLLYIYHLKNKEEKENILNTVIENQEQMKIWKNNCIENFQHKYYLIEAEKFRVLNKEESAETFYNKAIFEANKNNFLSEEAICWETAARFYLKKDNEIFAKMYFQNAYKTYKVWGAFAKLKQLEKKYPQFIFEKENTKSLNVTNKNTTIISNTTTVIGTSSFDMESIVKASQSLSGEVKLEKLLKSILMIIMENAGADYAVIIKNDNENFTIEAKGKYGFENITVLQSENLETSKSVILNMVKYVIRTKKSVLIDDISKNKDYENDEYLKTKSLKSVFCYPIIHKNKMVSILYLENSASSYAFTEERIKTINILSSQIAVSIENAQLYETMENKVISRTAQLQQAKDEIEHAHTHITDSINYAKRIQDAILPTAELFEKHFADYFILFKPRDIVSGDFYWAKRVNDYFIFAAADCTGHGVPGAFVSMLGISFLNEIARMEEIKTSAQILEELRLRVKSSLNQTDNKSESKDGMDIAVCVINTKTNVLQYAGAYNPLYLIRNNKLIVIKATRSPIGIYVKEKAFVNNEIQLMKNDVLYTFSDGYIDQFGGEKGHKYNSKIFKELLLKISDKPMPYQLQVLDKEFENWRGDIEQIDDVLVMGVKI